MVAQVGRHTDIHLSLSANEACGGPSCVQILYRAAASGSFVGALADSIIYEHPDLSEEEWQRMDEMRRELLG